MKINNLWTGWKDNWKNLLIKTVIYLYNLAVMESYRTVCLFNIFDLIKITLFLMKIVLPPTSRLQDHPLQQLFLKTKNILTRTSKELKWTGIKLFEKQINFDAFRIMIWLICLYKFY